MSAELIDLVQRMGQPRVLVVGDLMLDRYVWGDAERISQEAPVILLRADKREERLGGASSVATMLRALGARVSIAGVIGRDADGERIRSMLDELEIEQDALVADETRPSTVKERYVGRAQHKHPQQMMRVDYEERRAVDDVVARQLSDSIVQQVRHSDIILISDYDKGVCTPFVLANLIAAARRYGLRTLADPLRGSDYRKYHGCSAITPNRLEAGLATGRELNSQPPIDEAACQLQEQLDLEAAIITLDKDGMCMKHRDGRLRMFPTRQRQVYDITGAGDMVMSMLGVALASGASYDSAIALANVAGGLEVEKIGVATVTREEILHDLQKGHAVAASPLRDKVVSLAGLTHELDLRRRQGQKVVFTNGCFDILHAGHVQYLQDARAQGDLLVVGVNSDASLRGLKGEGRPMQPLKARATVLAGLQSVDYVVSFEEGTPIKLIHAVRPDVLVKGADYRVEEVVGGKFVESYGGRVYLAPLVEGFSTTSLIEKMHAA